MTVSMRQQARVGSYLVRQKLKGRKKFPLIVELEPLFACNLACAGCGKIQYPAHMLKQRMSVERALDAIEESGAPMVSIAGGEPLIHPEIHVIAAELVKRKKFVYLCTNALLMQKKLPLFEPSPYFAWAVHIDGLRERHDESVVPGGRVRRGRRRDEGGQSGGVPRDDEHDVLHTRHAQERAGGARLPERRDQGRRDDDLARRTRTGRRRTRSTSSGSSRRARCSARPSPAGGRKRWRLNHTPVFLDFLEGKVDLECTPWGIPSYSIFGWQRPCYLQSDGYCRDVPGAGGDHRLVEVRTAEREHAVRELHGALRLRADRGPRDDGFAEAIHPGRRHHVATLADPPRAVGCSAW